MWIFDIWRRKPKEDYRLEFKLLQRRIEVQQLYAKGYSRDKIANLMDVSIRTIDRDIAYLFQKPIPMQRKSKKKTH